MKAIRDLFVTARFFYIMAALIAGMTLSYPFPFLLPVVKTAFVEVGVVCLADGLLLFSRRVGVTAKRETPSVFSLGDDNPVKLTFSNLSGLKLKVEVIDELPAQFQRRDFDFEIRLTPFETLHYTYHL